jgi:lysophospholipase L1-like esterase
VGRARRAKKVAAAAAYGGGGLTALGALGVAVMATEVKLARRTIGTPFGQSTLDADGIYGAGTAAPIELLVIGDSSAAGLGADTADQTPGAVLARGLSAVAGQRVRLTTVAVVGAVSADLDAQLDRAFDQVPEPDVAVIMVGANDVTHRVRPAAAVRSLTDAVQRLQEHGCEVVVGTCPDLGTIEPVAQPLRLLARRMSRDLAAAQTVAAVEAGARSVSLGDLLGPEFRRVPHEMFSADRYHPSSAGYAAAAAAVLPSVCAALGLWPDGGHERAPDARRGEGVGPISVAAQVAAADPGTEVSGTAVGGRAGGPRGRWAVLLRRRREPVVPHEDDTPDGPDASDSPDAEDGPGSAAGDGRPTDESKVTTTGPSTRG